MTDLIPRDAAIEAITTCGDAAVTDALGQRLCCNGHMCGCRGSTVEEMLTYEIRAIPATDPAAIREAALREAVKSLRIWHAIAHSLYPNSATTVGMAADVVEALIGEKK